MQIRWPYWERNTITRLCIKYPMTRTREPEQVMFFYEHRLYYFTSCISFLTNGEMIKSTTPAINA